MKGITELLSELTALMEKKRLWLVALRRLLTAGLGKYYRWPRLANS
jgi:hypothetical protein